MWPFNDPRDIQYNDIRHNDTKYNDTKYNFKLDSSY